MKNSTTLLLGLMDLRREICEAREWMAKNMPPDGKQDLVGKMSEWIMELAPVITALEELPKETTVPFEKALRDLNREKGYDLELGELDIGTKFQMLAYESTYIRIMVNVAISNINISKFNDDGVHVPIVDLRTGQVCWMSKRKPVRKVLL